MSTTPVEEVGSGPQAAQAPSALTLAANEYDVCVEVALDLHDLWLDGELGAFTLSLELVDDLAPPMRFTVLSVLLDLIECRSFPELVRDPGWDALDVG
ncbi:MAG: hypothetical protein IT198_07685 [Acidimicrobiia bacterium]|nr:hypothetical protein [Acidimicrobiia bacterium]